MEIHLDQKGKGLITTVHVGRGQIRTFRAWHRVYGLGFKVQGLKCRVQVLGFRVQGSGLRA